VPLKLDGTVNLNVPSVRGLAQWAGTPLNAPGNGFGPLAIAGKLSLAGDKIGFSDASLSLDKINGKGEVRRVKIDKLVVDPGAVFVGKVMGPGTNGALEFASGAKYGMLSGLGTEIEFFATTDVEAGATWYLSGDVSGSTLFNAGEILVLKKQTLVFGAINAAESGSIDLFEGGAAEFKDALGTNQSLFFTGTGDFLKLDAPAHFLPTISGFAKGDTIDLAKTQADKASFSLNQLTITDNGKLVATLNLKGDFAMNQFKVTSDHHGGTEITLGKAAAAMPDFVYAGSRRAGPGGGSAEGVAGGGNGGRIEGFTPFGGGAGPPVGGATDGGSLIPWASDPFHFWTIQG
jgi:hypothetical protein